jgi:hypothetical protein
MQRQLKELINCLSKNMRLKTALRKSNLDVDFVADNWHIISKKIRQNKLKKAKLS